MKKKSFFMRTYDLNKFLTFINVVMLIFTILIYQVPVDFLGNQLMGNLKIIRIDSLIALIILLLILGTSIGTEWIIRIKDKSWLEWFKSIRQTAGIRSYLKQEQITQQAVDNDEQQEQIIDPINEKFNLAVRKSVVDIKNKKVSLIIPLPKGQQSQKLLMDMKKQIREEIANRNRNYYFSEPERVGNDLSISGDRK
ncbi:hypothetical protein ERK17_09650 [Lactobacillus kullabergensis]|nr:hypothetical protein [Lactobacillus kullabergensis]